MSEMSELTKILKISNPNMTLLSEEKGYTIIEIHEPLGSGTMRSIQVAKGIFLTFCDFKMHRESHQNHKLLKPSVEISYCLEGMAEGRAKNGRRFRFSSDEFGCIASGSVDYVSMFNQRYRGVSLLMVIDEASETISRYTNISYPRIASFFQSLSQNKNISAKMTTRRLRHIFKELYVLPTHFYKEHLQLKVMEIILCLMSGDDYTDEDVLYLPISLQDKVVAVHDFLMVDVKCKLTIPELANMVGTNQTDLMKGFKSLYGCTIRAFLNKERMDKARTLLLSTDLSIRDIAESVGYKHSGKFTASFKKRYDLTPNQMRKMYH